MHVQFNTRFFNSEDLGLHLTYHKCSNYAYFLILHQNALQTGVISNDASLPGNSFPIVASHGFAGSKSGRTSLPVTVNV